MEPSSRPAVRALSYNIRHGQGVVSLPSNQRIARVIGGLAPTFAGLQEVWRHPLFDQPARLAGLTGLESHYHETHTVRSGGTGNLLLAAATIHRVEWLSLGGRREQRGCLLADAEVREACFRIAVTHLSLHRATRQAQIARLDELLPRDMPLILVGDFNCGRSELSPLADWLTFAGEEPRTYPSVLPLRALDHIGYSAHWSLDQVLTVPSLASDHLPLVADLRLRA